MKATLLLPLRCLQNGAKRIPMGLVLAVAVTFLHQNATAAPIVDLGTAANFAILGGQQVTFTPPTTTVTGDVGVWPGNGAPATSITGVPANLTLTGSSTLHNSNAVAQQAQSDLTAAYLAAAAAPFTATLPNSLGSGQTLGPGVYNFTLGTTVNLVGALNLSGSGLFVFQVPADLQTAVGSSVGFFNGADSCDVIWQVTSSANLLGSDFDGTILALTSITVGAGVTVDGRLLARNGLVSLIGDTIFTDQCQPGTGGVTSVPDTGSTLLLLGPVMASLFGLRRLFFSPA